jgi:hypothetical protein
MWLIYVLSNGMEYGFFQHSYEDPDGIVKLTVPSQWKTTKESPRRWVFNPYQDVSDTFVVSATLTIPDTTRAARELGKAFPEEGRDNEVEQVVAGRDARVFSSPTSAKHRGFVIGVLRRVAVIESDPPSYFVLTCRAEDWPEYREDFRTMLESLKF